MAMQVAGMVCMATQGQEWPTWSHRAENGLHGHTGPAWPHRNGLHGHTGGKNGLHGHTGQGQAGPGLAWPGLARPGLA